MYCSCKIVGLFATRSHGGNTMFINVIFVTLYKKVACISNLKVEQFIYVYVKIGITHNPTCPPPPQEQNQRSRGGSSTFTGTVAGSGNVFSSTEHRLARWYGSRLDLGLTCYSLGQITYGQVLQSIQSIQLLLREIESIIELVKYNDSSRQTQFMSLCRNIR